MAALDKELLVIAADAEAPPIEAHGFTESLELGEKKSSDEGRKISSALAEFCGTFTFWRMFPSPILKTMRFFASLRDELQILFSFRPLGRWFNVTLADVFIVVSFLLFNVVYVLSIVTKDDWEEFGDGSFISFTKAIGKLLHYQIALLLLPIARNGIFALLLGTSFELLIKYHRWLGRWIFATILFHAFFVYLDWLINDHKEFFSEMLTRKNIFGQLAALINLVIIITTLEFVRRRFFEVFYKLHIVLFIPFLVCVALHHKYAHFLIVISVPLGLYVIDVLFRAFDVLFKPVGPVNFSCIGSNIVKIEIMQPWLRRYQSGQYFYFYLPRVSFFQVHPFSVASAPHEKTTVFYLQTYKNGWVYDLKNLVGDKRYKSSIRMEGPYGNLSIKSLHKYKMIVLIAGGVGVTPILSIIKHLHHEVQSSRASFFVVKFIWSFRQRELYDDLIDSLNEISASPEFKLSLHQTGNVESDSLVIDKESSSVEICNERPDIHGYLKKMHQYAEENGISEIGCIVCGPSALKSQTRASCASISTCGTRIHLQMETFHL